MIYIKKSKVAIVDILQRGFMAVSRGGWDLTGNEIMKVILKKQPNASEQSSRAREKGRKGCTTQ